MKSKLIMAGLMVILAVSLVACSPASEKISVDISCDDFTASKHVINEFELPVGGEIVVTLCSNPTTGFEWEPAVISDEAVLKQVSHEYIGPESDPPPPLGTPGQEVWTFETLKAGTTEVSMQYSRPWEGGEKGEWTYNFTVTVK